MTYKMFKGDIGVVLKIILYILIGIAILFGLYKMFIDDEKGVGYASFIFAVLVFFVTLIPNDKEEKIDYNSTGYFEDDLNGEDSNSDEKDSSDNSEGVSNSETSESSYEEPVDENKETDSDKGILKIDSIVANMFNAVAIENVPFEIQPNEIIGFSGEVSRDGQSNDYEYIPPLSGAYRFEFSNVPNGTDLRLRIYNSGWEQIEVNSDLDNGDGITKFLTAGEIYYIRVEQYREIGAYTLNIGPQKDIVDLTNYTAVSDSIQYTSQTNDYSYVAETDGVYRFEFSNVPNGTDLRLRIYNSGWEQIEVNSDLDNGDGITEFLTAGEKYYIRVEQYREYGSYTLNIGKKKEVIDITNYTAVSDSVQYTDQENDYLFIAKAEGTYRFIFSNVSEGNSFRLGIFNSGWEKLESNSNLGNGGELKVSLLAGESYFIKVTQYGGSGNYILTTERQYE